MGRMVQDCIARTAVCKAGTRATGPKDSLRQRGRIPMNVELYDHPCDDNEMGYVEVMETWHGPWGTAGLP